MSATPSAEPDVDEQHHHKIERYIAFDAPDRLNGPLLVREGWNNGHQLP